MMNKQIQQTRALLVEMFPNCFFEKGKDKRPIKVGIYADIRQRLPEIGSRRLAVALSDYTNGHKYLIAVTDGATRWDLDGNEAGVVTKSQADHAAGRIIPYQQHRVAA